jgi:hypothetical protein
MAVLAGFGFQILNRSFAALTLREKQHQFDIRGNVRA